MEKDIIIVWDCGATNVRAVAINESGIIIQQETSSNQTFPDPHFESGLIWSVDDIWQKLVNATNKLLPNLNSYNIAGITVTTFGVDGAPMTKNGELLYPVISWACQRTIPLMAQIRNYISIEELYEISGVNQFSFNTIFKLLWFKENKPEVLKQMDHFVFMPSILSHKLCGEFTTDVSMAGTSMLTDLNTRDFSPEILEAIHPPLGFPPMVEAGTHIGNISKDAAKETGLPKGLPVLAGGHDTQFAVYGTGAGENEVVLSSGTWEILMARTKYIDINKQCLDYGVTVEYDVKPGMYNPGLQWLGSGILEWVKNMFYAHEKSSHQIYDIMIDEARQVSSDGIEIELDFLNSKGGIKNLGTKHNRAQIYRACLEALAHKTKESLDILQEVGKFRADKLIVTGGGSKNKLWNSLREAELGIPIKVIDQTESTVIGAAKVAFESLAQ